MYKNIIFDIGNVLLNFQPMEYLLKKVQEVDKAEAVHQVIFQSKEWQMLDRGTLTEEEAKAILMKRSKGYGDLIALAFKNWYELLTPIEESVEILRELKRANYKVYFLSNFHLLAFEYVNKNYDFFKHFDGGIVSFREKMLKPEEGIYHRLISEYGIKPQESIFIDDVEENIEGAERLNFGGILFRSPQELREKLKELHIDL